MRALMYADWSIIRKTFLRYLIVTIIVMTPVVAMGNADGEFSAGVAVASMLVAMITIYLAIGLFSADEANGWEQFRLTYPTSARQVVRSRYALTALTTFATVILATALGTTVQWAIPLFLGSVAAPRGIGIIALTSLGTGLAALAFLAIEMPVIFRVGISKARMTFWVPFAICMMFSVEPIRKAIMPILHGLEHLAKSVGSPAPLFVVAACLIALLYLGSMRLSERIYAARDF